MKISSRLQGCQIFLSKGVQDGVFPQQHLDHNILTKALAFNHEKKKRIENAD